MSTADKDQDPENQLGPLRNVAERKGWVYEEMRFKQSRFDEASYREVTEKILARLESGGFDVLAVWAWDRISRQGAEEAFRFLRVLEDHLGVRFFSLQERFLCTEAGREQRELLLPIIAWVANQSSRRQSDRVRARVEQKKAASAKLGQRAVWGRGRIATPAEAEDVRARYAAGESTRTIAAATGIPKSQVGRLVKGLPQSSPLGRGASQAGAP